MEFVANSHELPQFKIDIREPVFLSCLFGGIYLSTPFCTSFLKDDHILLIEVDGSSFWEFTNAEQKEDICPPRLTSLLFCTGRFFCASEYNKLDL